IKPLCPSTLMSITIYCYNSDLPPFPTRRSSDLEHARLLRVCRDGDRDRGEERERDDESGHGTRERWETTATGVRQSAAPFGMWVPPLHARIGLTRQSWRCSTSETRAAARANRRPSQPYLNSRMSDRNVRFTGGEED